MQPGRVLATVALVQFLVSLDLSIVNVALPRIRDGLGFSPIGLTWVINAYALTFGGLLLLGGKAADRYGRKKVLVIGLVLFGLASLAGGLAQAPVQLVIARAVQGIGAATLAPAALSLLTATFPAGRPRIRAFGVWSAVNAAGGAFGVLTGGVLTEYAGWRWVMFVNLPVVAVALVLARRSLAADRGSARRYRPDVVGALLVTAGLTLLVLAVVRTDQHAWTSAVTVSTLAIAAALLAGFTRHERTTAREPLLRLGLLASRSVAGANAYNVLLGAVMASAFYFLTLYLQGVLGAGPAVTGLMFLPFALGVIAGSAIAVKLGYRVEPWTLLVVGGLLAAAGFAWYGFISPDGTYLVDVLGPEILASLGYGLCLAPVVSLATAGVAPEESGAASGLLNSSRQIGASLGLAVLGTLAYRHTGHAANVQALSAGYARGLILDSALMIAAILIALTVLRTTSRVPRRDARSRKKRHPRIEIKRRRPALVVMYAGLVLTLVAILAPYVDRATGHVLADHIRAGYPAYTRARIDSAVTAWLVILTVIGALGTVSWIATIWAVRAGKGWARWAATVIFAVGTSVALTALLAKDTSGEVGLAPLLGWVGLLPCLAGLGAVTLLWRRT